MGRHSTFVGILATFLVLSVPACAKAADGKAYGQRFLYEMTVYVQSALINEGYEIGTPDGRCGSKTADAIDQYLNRIGVTGRPSSSIDTRYEGCRKVPSAFSSLRGKYGDELAKSIGFRFLQPSDIDAAKENCAKDIERIEKNVKRVNSERENAIYKIFIIISERKDVIESSYINILELFILAESDYFDMTYYKSATECIISHLDANR
jgi:hypothetical protein